MNGYTVEHDSEVQICICQMDFIEVKEFLGLMQVYIDLGYRYIKESDDRGGLILSKVQR